MMPPMYENELRRFEIEDAAAATMMDVMMTILFDNRKVQGS